VCARVNARNYEPVTQVFMFPIETGPKNTPYEGGRFKVDIQIPAHYPLCTPRVTFLTKIWHPNVSSKNGTMCLFRDDWSPALFVISVVRALQCLLDEPEPDDPHDETVTAQYISDFDKFSTTAREWTKRYASDESLEPLNVPRLIQPPSWGGDAKNLDKVREHLENAMSCVDESSGNFQEGVYVQIASDLKSIYDYISPVI
jgi:ubiquitin-protein ligase